MTRRVVLFCLLFTLLAALIPPGVSAQDAPAAPPKIDDPMRAFSIVPPGQEGDVTVDELPGDYGPHYDDQLEMYASLIDDDDVAEGELGKYFHSMQFGPGETIEETYSPAEGVTIYRDELGIPHIYADTEQLASFGLGYVTAEDRLWQSDVLRHAARGTLSELVGPDYLEMDIATRREGYTEEEITKMFERFDEKFGALGKTIQEGLQNYADGFNAYLAELAMNADACPAEYQALGNPCPAPFPSEWTVNDTLFLVVLQLRVFGETAGSELTNAGFYALLKERLGDRVGSHAFEDFFRRNDPRSPTTIEPQQAVFESPELGATKATSFAVPEGAQELARDVAAEESARADLLAGLGLKIPASNALLVSGSESVTGNPLHIGAPQVGYAVPAFFMDVDVHAPGLDMRGPAVPGASALIPLGRGQDYAWSLTTGYSDAVDTRIELLCDPEGGEVSEESNGYMFKGKCKEMTSREETFIVKPSAGSPGPPDVHTETFYRTQHGPVFERGNVDGKPVAFVKQRFFWKKELDSIPAFYRWNARVESVKDFKAAASRFTMSFNSFYADHKDIGYFHVGYYPQRPKGMHPSLPTWGTGEWEWTGRVPFDRHPQVINPRAGWLANWNNKPSVGWDNMDGIKWGPIQRVQLLKDKMREFTAGARKAKLSDLVDVIRDAATRDARATYLGPKMVRWASDGADEKTLQALTLVKAWVKDGAHRLNKDRDDNEDNGPAAAIFDAWYEQLVHGIFDDEIGPDNYDLVPAPIADQDMWFDFSSFIRNLFDENARRAYARDYCDNMETKETESCKQVVAKALGSALEALTTDQGEDASAWTTPAWWITYQNLGLGSVPLIPWQNRGTHNHVVEILRKGR